MIATWRSLEPHTRRWVFWQFVVVAAVVNAVLSALIAWLLTLQQESVEFAGVPLVDRTTVLVDSLSTLFVLPFLTLYFAWKRPLHAAMLCWIAPPFIAAIVFANL